MFWKSPCKRWNPLEGISRAVSEPSSCVMLVKVMFSATPVAMTMSPEYVEQGVRRSASLWWEIVTGVEALQLDGSDCAETKHADKTQHATGRNQAGMMEAAIAEIFEVSSSEGPLEER